MHVGKNIQSLRKHLNMTQQDLAERLCMSRSAISRIESKSSADIELVHSISKILNVPIIYLIYGINDSQDEALTGDTQSRNNSIRDLYTNSTTLYRKLPHERKSFSRAIGLEIHREILQCETRAIERFSRSLKTKILSLFSESDETIKSSFINFIDAHTSDWIKRNGLQQML
ncbi:helix-turn-helix transcriptional regulator [Wukongibacter baidiensis]|uniref:helix-turn-helix domain-containing protein n=1 Tax=Wukongibacter baidiensis TaxID=1723361 RepID=UPI003D7F6D2A